MRAEHRQEPDDSTSWFRVFSCLTKQVPKLPEDFNRPLYQYLFETFSRNTHLLPLGVPMSSDAEDYESTAEFESCLWGKPNPLTVNDIEGKTVGQSAYQQLFADRQGGYEYSVGLSLLGGKMVAAIAGYVVHVLTMATS